MSDSRQTVKFASNWVKFEHEEGMDMREDSTYAEKPCFLKKPGLWGLVLLGGWLAVTPATLAKPVPVRQSEVKQYYQEAVRRRDVDGYLVYVDRYSANLLEVVRRVDRSATRVRFRGRDVIQLGVYRNRSTAERQIRRLQERGLLAELATVDVRRFSRLLLVLIPTRDRRVLREVQQVVDNATIIRYRGRYIIRAGVFEDEVRAARLVKRLRDRGLLAQIVPIEFEENVARYEYREYREYRDDERRNYRLERDNDEDYYSVIIPCREEEMPAIAAQIEQIVPDMGMQQAISMRNESDGSFVMIGPFRNREAAENWHRYFRDFGMENAQVYYGR